MWATADQAHVHGRANTGPPTAQESPICCATRELTPYPGSYATPTDALRQELAQASFTPDELTEFLQSRSKVEFLVW